MRLDDEELDSLDEYLDFMVRGTSAKEGAHVCR